MLHVFFELIEQLPEKVQRIVAGIIAASLFMFFVFLAYLYFTGNLW